MSTTLSRRDALRALAFSAGALALPRFAFAQDQKAAAKPQIPSLQTTALADRLSVIMNAGGNVAVLIGEEGPLVVDCGVPAMGLPLLAEVKKLSANPSATLINTHWHYDHAGGNEVFAKAGARIVAHANCRQRLSTDQVIEFMDNMKSPAVAKIALPTTTVSSELTLHANGEEIRLTSVPAAHTDGDLLVFFAKANVLHMGDLYFNGFYPFIDYSSGGWIGGMVAAAEKALSLTDAKTKIIPGHGPIATQDDLKGYRDMLAVTHERLGKLFKEGKSIDEVVAAKPMKDYDEKLGKGFMPPEKYLRCTYTGLQRRK